MKTNVSNIKKIFNQVIFLNSKSSTNINKEYFLSFFWIIFSPLLVMISWGFMKSLKIINVSNLEVPYTYFVLYNFVFFSLFKELVSLPRSTISGYLGNSDAYRFLFASEFIHRLLNVGRDFLIRFLVLILVAQYYSVSPNFIINEVLGFLCIVIFSISFGFLIAPFLMCIKDLSKLWSLIFPYTIFISPVFYKIPFDTTNSIFKVILYNPLSYLLGMMQSSYISYNYDFIPILLWITFFSTIYIAIFFIFFKKRLQILH